MTDRRTGMPVDTDDVREDAAGGAAGYRGERAQDRTAGDPELRREVDTVDGPVEVEDSSGSQHVEAAGESGLTPQGRGAEPEKKPQAAPKPPPRRAENSVVAAERPSDSAAWRVGTGLAAAAGIGIGAAAFLARVLWKRTG
jgi:hypothetical protein